MSRLQWWVDRGDKCAICRMERFCGRYGGQLKAVALCVWTTEVALEATPVAMVSLEHCRQLDAHLRMRLTLVQEHGIVATAVSSDSAL
jgi:hypothetical protein